MEIDMDADEEACSFSSSQLLQLAEDHLRLRNYSLSSQYALESLHSDADFDDNSPLGRRAALIVAVSDVLFGAAETLGSATNWYSVLGVDTFCIDLDAIRLKFKSLLLLLGPVRANFPLANEAMKSAWNAWMVLSNPEKKSALDAELTQGLATERHEVKNGMEERESFWTFCPYCYYMYEYARVYEGYSLRCQNVSCKRAFQGVSIWSSPPVELKEDENFGCFGCFPLGLSQLQEATNSKYGLWSPFVSMFPFQEARNDAKSQGLGVDLDDVTNFVEISDDSDVSEAPRRSKNKRAQLANQGNGKSVGPNARKLTSKGRKSKMNENANVSNARAMGEEHAGNWDDYEEEHGIETAEGAGCADKCGLDAEVEFFEKDGEIFLQLPPDDTF